MPLEGLVDLDADVGGAEGLRDGRGDGDQLLLRAAGALEPFGQARDDVGHTPGDRAQVVRGRGHGDLRSALAVRGGHLRGHVLEVHERLSAHADLAQHAFFSAVAPSTAEDLEARARASQKVRNFIGDAEIVKVIVREPKLVNLVIR